MSSCKYYQKPYWLDYNNGSSFTAKLIYTFILLIGISLLIFEINIERNLAVCTVAIPNVLKWSLRIFQMIAVGMIVIPIFFFFIDYSATFKTDTKFPYMLIGLSLLSIMAIVMLILAIIIQSNYAQLNCPNLQPFSAYLWVPIIIFLCASSFLTVYRFKSISKVNIEKRDVNWINVRGNSALVETIGKKQAKQCDITLEDGAASTALQHYIDKKKQEVNANANVFTRWFTTPNLNLPKGQIPNIPKMFEDLKYDLDNQGQKKK